MKELVEEDEKRLNFKPRRTYLKRDAKQSNWWFDYVFDVRGTFNDINHRDGKPFAERFSFSFKAVKKIADKISQRDEFFWKNDADASGGPPHQPTYLSLDR